jgi:hypothetical protein
MSRILNLIFAVLLISGAVFLFSQQGTIRKLREENVALSTELRTAEESKAASSAQPVQREAKLAPAEFSELLRLRGEVGELRKLSNEVQTLKRDTGKRGGEMVNVQPVPATAALNPIQQEIQRQNATLEQALGMYKAGQISLAELVRQKKQRFEYLANVAAADPGMLKREELVDRELGLNITLLQQAQASGATNSPEMKDLENELRNLQAEKGAANAAGGGLVPPGVAK